MHFLCRYFSRRYSVTPDQTTKERGRQSRITSVEGGTLKQNPSHAPHTKQRDSIVTILRTNKQSGNETSDVAIKHRTDAFPLGNEPTFVITSFKQVNVEYISYQFQLPFGWMRSSQSRSTGFSPFLYFLCRIQ